MFRRFAVSALVLHASIAFTVAPRRGRRAAAARRGSARRAAAAGADDDARRRDDEIMMQRWFDDHEHVSFAALATPSSPAASAGLVVPRASGAPAPFGLDATAEPESIRARLEANSLPERDRALVDECIAYLGWRLVHQEDGAAAGSAAARAGGLGDDDDDDDGVSADFIAEGRRLLSVRRFHVVRDACDEYSAWGACWDELAHLAKECAADDDACDVDADGRASAPSGANGALIALPGFPGDVHALVRDELVAGARYLGLDAALEGSGRAGTTLEVKGFRVLKGAPCPLVRIVANVGEPPKGRATAA